MYYRPRAVPAARLGWWADLEYHQTMKSPIEIDHVHVTLVPDQGELLGIGTCQLTVGEFRLQLAHIGIRRKSDGNYELEYPARVKGVARYPHYKPVNQETSAVLEKALLRGFMEACEREDDETRPL